MRCASSVATPVRFISRSLLELRPSLFSALRTQRVTVPTRGVCLLAQPRMKILSSALAIASRPIVAAMRPALPCWQSKSKRFSTWFAAESDLQYECRLGFLRSLARSSGLSPRGRCLVVCEANPAQYCDWHGCRSGRFMVARLCGRLSPKARNPYGHRAVRPHAQSAVLGKRNLGCWRSGGHALLDVLSVPRCLLRHFLSDRHAQRRSGTPGALRRKVRRVRTSCAALHPASDRCEISPEQCGSFFLGPVQEKPRISGGNRFSVVACPIVRDVAFAPAQKRFRASPPDKPHSRKFRANSHP